MKMKADTSIVSFHKVREIYLFSYLKNNQVSRNAGFLMISIYRLISLLDFVCGKNCTKISKYA